MTAAHDDLDSAPPPQPKRTQLPMYQLFIVYLTQFTEPVTASVIYPFVNQFVRDTGVIDGDERKTGYYAGFIGSAFFFAEALTVYHWGVASDRFGRRPVLLLGPIGLGLAMLSFGLSRKYWMLVVSRCIQGVFNGNIGVSKTVIAEITDATNIADAYAFMPMIFSAGFSLGPIIGGVLSEPATRWPRLFGTSRFFHGHPYFLPCVAAGGLAFISGAIAFVSLKETSPAAIAREKKMRRVFQASDGSVNYSSPLLDGPVRDYGSREDTESFESEGDGLGAKETPPPFKALLVPRVLIPLIVYMVQALIDMSSQVLLPLMYSTSIPLGGLGFDAYHIGVILSVWGFVNAIVMLMVLGRAIRKFGPRTVHIFSYAAYFVNVALYPLLSYFVRRSGRVDAKAWGVIVAQLVCRLMNGISYGSIQIIIVNNAPSRAALGATNGLAQALGSVTRGLGPSVASSLFSVSLEWQSMGGDMVYVVLSGLALVGMGLAFMLPKEIQSQKR